MNENDFKNYLRDCTNLRDGTCDNYVSYLKNKSISAKLKEEGLIEDNIFEIEDRATFDKVVNAVNALSDDKEFKPSNKTCLKNFNSALKKLKKYVDEKNVFNEPGGHENEVIKTPPVDEEPLEVEAKDAEYPNRLKNKYARNRIIFGAPGTGKSYNLDQEKIDLLGIDNTIPNDKEDQYERVTFYPDYSYANFVGTYKPVPATDEKGNIAKDSNENDVITYKYVPGPFMRIYVKAKSHSDKDYLLIIEEINRANAAAVFGDVFQLLDRNKNGESEYSVQISEDARNYLKEKFPNDPDKCSKIRIPSNMYIWATMNSADQGVYPLDTAFKRRWSFEYIGIDDAKGALSKKYVNIGKGKNKQHVKWDNLRMAINNFLSKEKINEDKQLGPYFIDPELIPNDAGIDDKTQEFIDVFKDKVLMYLYEDAARQKRDKLFGESRYSDICSHFDKLGVYVFKEVIWKEEQLASDLQRAQEQDEAKDEVEEDETGNEAGSGEMDKPNGKDDDKD